MENVSAVSLRQGLHKLQEENTGVFSDGEISPEAQEFFRCHDVAHVVFGCDTTLFGEGVLKLFTIFGTTLGFWSHLFGYSEGGAFGLFRQYSALHFLKNLFWLLLNAPRAIFRARRMSKPWPWADHSEYMDRSLEDIRTEFNIVVIPHPRREARKVA